MNIDDVRDTLFGLFHRHFVVLHVTFTKPGGEVKDASYSTFVMSVGDQWFLVTAGHCIDELVEAVKQGYRIGCELFDNLTAGSTYRGPIPFEYDPAEAVSLDKEGVDFGIFRLGYMYRRLLAANGVEPLDERGWRMRPENYNPFKYLLMGIPANLTRRYGQAIQYMPSLYPVEPLPERPDYIEEADVPTFYGKVQLDQGESSIVGTSGGPIFSFQEVDGKLKYWLHALQSSWYPSERVIVAPLIQALGYLLELVQKRIAEQEMADAPDAG